MNTMNKTQVAEVVRLQFEGNKIANPTYTASFDDLSGLVAKVGATIRIPGRYVDKLPEFNAGTLSLGTIVEEWKEMLLEVKDFDRDGANNMRPNRPKFAKVHYSYETPKKTITSQQDYDRFEKYSIDGSVLGQLVAAASASMQDTRTNYDYEYKRELLGRAMKLAYEAMGSASVSFQTSHAYSQGDYVNDGTNYGVVLFDIGGDNAKSYATLVSEGIIVNLSLVQKIAKPVDTATGEAFIKQIKCDAEIASEQSEGTSLNGITIGAPVSTSLYIKFGINPSLDVDTLSGAFNPERLAMGAPVKALPDFGKSAPANAFAVMVDSSALKVFTDSDRYNTDSNGEGDFIKFYNHIKYTPFFSCNAFIKVYVAE